MQAPELWAGHECTVNRIGADYRDQSHASGHHGRDSDIDLFADLGVAALRYPVLWERVAPGRLEDADWTWTDRRLARLRARGVRPIAGLVHHGSGPRHTNLLDDTGFAAGLGWYAGAVAARYPWIDDYTPVNEPLTTARFSALYGHWHPHTRDEGSFWRALLNQIDGTRAAMLAIRRVNPRARLVQTDDLGRSYATVQVAEQAAFDNLRRWAGWDLLFGRVTPHHPLFERLARAGLGDRARRIADDPCPPDIVGVNHYPTSDRFLDHRLARYPRETHGGNGRIDYADVEAVRVLDPPPQGFAGAVREAWQRYRTPIAMTEVHNGCTREEQLRWAAEAWDDAVALQAEGVDVRAVTAWALLGSHGWNTLLTGPGRYEPGVFDLTEGPPRPTALAALWKGLPHGAARHPVTAAAGWWRRPDRLLYPTLRHPAGLPRRAERVAPRPLLLHGAATPLGAVVAAACTARALAVVTGRTAVEDPWAVLDASGGDIALSRQCSEVGLPYLGFVAEAPAEVPRGALLVRTADPAAALAAALDWLIDGVTGVRDGQCDDAPNAPIPVSDRTRCSA